MDYSNLDLTNIAQLTKAEVIEMFHKITAVPSVIIVWISTMLLFLIFGLVLVKEDRGRLMLLWGIVLLLSGIVVLAVVFMPNTVQSFSQWWTNFWGF